MATLENLPDDQRAVLQLVLQRGRGYDEIARLLSIDRAGVRQRALHAFDALGPQTGVVDQRRALITDYLLGQLPAAVAADVRDHLARSPSERAWARVLASELAPLTNKPLPEIPTEITSALEPAAEPPPAAVAAPAAKPKKPRESVLLRRRRRKQAAAVGAAGAAAAESAPAEAATPAAETAPPGAQATPPGTEATPPETEAQERRSSRLGGAILIAVGVLIAAALVVFILGLATGGPRGGGGKPHRAAAIPSASATSSAPAAASSTTSGSAAGAHVVAQVNLRPTTKGSKAAGIAEILKEGSADGVAIVAQNVPPNSTKPPNAYAVWLYNSTHDASFLGFVNPGVSSNGKLSTAGGLPANASHFKQLIVTVETVAHPKAPGTIILAGPLSGL